jgi:hypothetical protein
MPMKQFKRIMLAAIMICALLSPTSTFASNGKDHKNNSQSMNPLVSFFLGNKGLNDDYSSLWGNNQHDKKNGYYHDSDDKDWDDWHDKDWDEWIDKDWDDWKDIWKKYDSYDIWKKWFCY